jgi:cobalt transporter subunit CbtB
MSTSSIDGNLTAPSNPACNAESPDLNAATTGVRWPAIIALLLGAIVILGVGFGPGIMHNAAHDTRHTMAFPCH